MQGPTKTLSSRALQEASNLMWKYCVTDFSSNMNSDHQLDDLDFDKNDKSKPNGMSRSRI